MQKYITQPWEMSYLLTNISYHTFIQNVIVLQESDFLPVCLSVCHGVILIFNLSLGFPDGSVIKNLPANAGDVGLIPVSGRAPEEGNDNPLQYSCLGNPKYRGTWQATVHGVVESDTS